ncbi:MAG TPA: hypothetical protein VHS09_00670 [Polyangiaceae bacterium]|jgi:hypothetical protein|nr:hypothetical protein [Polyangiaceae bacterium]
MRRSPLSPLAPNRSRTLAVLALGLGFAFVACEPNETHTDDHAPYEAGTVAPLSCVPNLDGVIDASELAAVLGVSVKYLVSPSGTSRPVDVAGATDTAGQLVWDFGTDYADDQIASIEASALQGKWYASSFPNGQFATPFDAADTLEAVYSQDADGLYLQGIASTQETPANLQTLLVYETPVTLYVFPLKVGATWTTTGVVRNGTLQGSPYAGQDTYQGTDLATGNLILPDLTFQQAHRIAFVVTTMPAAGENVVTRQDSFLFECFGEVARATSATNETNDDFTTASQVRRFTAQ